MAKLNSTDRRTILAQMLKANAYDKTRLPLSELAREWEVTPAQISQDLKSDELREIMEAHKLPRLFRMQEDAWELLELVIKDGINAAKADFPLYLDPDDAEDRKKIVAWAKQQVGAANIGAQYSLRLLEMTDGSMSFKIDLKVKTEPAPSEDPELIEVLGKSVDEKLASAIALIEFSTLPALPPGNGNGNGNGNGHDNK